MGRFHDRPFFFCSILCAHYERPGQARDRFSPMSAPAQRWRILALLSIAELLAMSLWFSASAVVPALRWSGVSLTQMQLVDYRRPTRLCLRNAAQRIS